MTRHSAAGGRTPVWAAGLLVAAAAGVATAHGLYEVAIAARVPAGIAWLYPLITDGLALVAYAATARLTDAGRRYAWTVVVLAAGLSGLAQAAYLAGGIGAAPTLLRFGVGAWPAVAAAIVAHLVHLLATPSRSPAESTARSQSAGVQPPVQPSASNRPTVGHLDAARPTQPSNLDAPLYDASTASNPAVQPASNTSPSADAADPEPVSSVPLDSRVAQPAGRPIQPLPTAVGVAPRDRARAAARGHQARHGRLPTVSELAQLARVAHGTAGTVLKELRTERPALQIVRTTPETSTDQ